VSYDGGKTFRVIKSIEGDCPNSGLKLDFNVPTDAKQGKAIFAWTWFNHTGNREMYMNCAAVDITGSGTSTLDNRPEIFVANIGKDCSVPDETDVKFPDPGSDLELGKNDHLKLTPPDCGSSSPPPAEGSDTNPASADPTSSAPQPEGSDTNPDSADPTYSPDPAVPTESAPTPTSAPVLSGTSTPSSTSQAPASTSDNNTSGVAPSYIVKAGDICTAIAAQQGVSLEDIFKNNPSVNKDCTNLLPGQTLVLRRRSRIMRDLFY